MVYFKKQGDWPGGEAYGITYEYIWQEIDYTDRQLLEAIAYYGESVQRYAEYRVARWWDGPGSMAKEYAYKEPTGRTSKSPHGYYGF